MGGRHASLEPAAEAEILAALRVGGRERDAGLRRLFRALREPVHALCLHVTGRRADADDATQEVFLAVHAALPRFRGECRLSTWVYRIALRAAFRTRARRREGHPLDPETPGGGGEGEMASRDEARRIGEAVGRLPAGPRAVIALFAVEGLSHREIADVLGIPEGTVWSRLHAARKMLAEVLAR